MNRLLSGVAAATFAMGGLMAVSSAPAQAAPYPGSVKTFCHISVTDAKGSRIELAVRVGAVGNGTPKGRITVELDKAGRGGVTTKSRSYDGGREDFDFKAKPGAKYTATLDFNSRPADSVYKDCDDSVTFRVTRR